VSNRAVLRLSMAAMVDNTLALHAANLLSFTKKLEWLRS